MKAELKEYNVKVSIPEPFTQGAMETYFGTERIIKDEYVQARNRRTKTDDQGVSGPEYNGIVARTVARLGWCSYNESAVTDLDPRAVTWVSSVVQREVLSYAQIPKV